MTVFFRFLTLAAMVFVLVMSLGPGPTALTDTFFSHDKVLHFLAYGFLATLARFGWPKPWVGWIALWFGAFGAGVELAQHFLTAGRTASIHDFIANMAGILVALLALHFLKILFVRRISP